MSQNKSLHLCLFQKKREDEDRRDSYARSKSPQKSFVQYFRSPSNDRTKHYDNRYGSRSISRNNSHNKTYSQIDTVLHLEIDLALTKVLLLHNTLDHDMILINAIHGLIALHPDLRIDLLIDTTLALDIDHAPIKETIILQNTQIHTDHPLDQEILDFLDPVHTPILETNQIDTTTRPI